MKAFKKISTFLALLMLCINVMIIPVFASSIEQDGLKVTFTTDKELYSKGEKVEVKLSITNTNNFAVEKISLKNKVPEGYKLEEKSVAMMQVESLQAGETVTLTAVYVADTTGQNPDDRGESGAGDLDDGKTLANKDKNTSVPVNTKNGGSTNKASTSRPDTGDKSNIVFWIILMLAAIGIIILIWAVRNKKVKKLLSLILCILMAGTSLFVIPIQPQAAGNDKKTIELKQIVQIAGENVELFASVIYATPETSASDELVTREEWLVSLAEVLELGDVLETQYSFDDYEKAENPATVEATIRAGFVPIQPDQDNMVYLQPDKLATREFVAYTAVHALEYQISSDDIPNWKDKTELTYPGEDKLAVALDIFSLFENSFMPEKELTVREKEQALSVIRRILDSSNITSGSKGSVTYMEGVYETEMSYELDEEAGKVYTSETEKIAGWKQGEVHVLISADDTQKDIAVKIIEIRQEDGWTVLYYEEPLLEEVALSFEVEGTKTAGGSMTPAEGVIFEDAPVSRAATSGSVPLFGKKNYSVNIDDITVKGSIDMKNIEYRFAASPSWHLITIDEVYMAVNCSTEADISWMPAGDEVDNDLIPDFAEDEPTEKRVKLANIDIPLPYGFNGSGEIYLIFSLKGGVEISFEVTSKAGIQYAKGNGIRAIKNINPVMSSINLKGEFKGGAAIEPGAEFLGIDLVSIGAEVGIGVDAELGIVKLNPWQCCIDATAYMFLTIYAQVGPSDLNLRYDCELFNSENSPWRENRHFEETGEVEKCTRGYGNYEGYVKEAENSIPIHNAKVQVLKGSRIVDTIYTDSHGKFVGMQLKSGEYKVRISASGYIPYERKFEIIGGDSTTLETQLMISRGDPNVDDEGYRPECTGVITNAFTGTPVENAKITVRSQFLFGEGDVVAVVESDSAGFYSFTAPIGSYELTVSKDGFVTNWIDVTLVMNKNNVNVSLNPDKQQTLSGNLRVVLHWGANPRDLDSHMVGPYNGGGFHVYYSNKVEEKVNLDVDDTSAYGPETISINETEDGVYSYYVHDYTNRNSSSSVALSQSEAYVELYAGNVLMYKIRVPLEHEGTLWHVFDYDPETDLVTLVNEFSYESTPSNIGRNMNVAFYGLDPDVDVELKDYEKVILDAEESQEEEIEEPEGKSGDTSKESTESAKATVSEEVSIEARGGVEESQRETTKELQNAAKSIQNEDAER